MPCSLARPAYKLPSFLSKSSGWPSSTIFPLSNTMTRFTSSDRMTPRRWVTITMLLVCCIAILRDPTTFFSLSESRAAVGSSSSSTWGSRMIARAMATRWRCPPDSDRPPSPIRVSSSSPSSFPGATVRPASLRQSETFVRHRALYTASPVSGSMSSLSIPYKTFSIRLIGKTWGSCSTMETCEAVSERVRLRRSSPSSSIRPLEGS
mmetsp:Transcript_16087/g.44510  ORF Transcript_16087/g.44510 Transcript_16087/m.44510 type:complete len:207 (-) Transcript_16087:2262-2882(-)